MLHPSSRTARVPSGSPLPGALNMDYLPTRWPLSPRIAVKCDAHREGALRLVLARRVEPADQPEKVGERAAVILKPGGSVRCYWDGLLHPARGRCAKQLGVPSGRTAIGMERRPGRYPRRTLQKKCNKDPAPERSNGRLTALDSDAALHAACARRAGMVSCLPRSARVVGAPAVGRAEGRQPDYLFAEVKLVLHWDRA